jgi:hypothetical protein
MNEGTNDRMTSAAARRSYVYNLITHPALMNSAVDFLGPAAMKGVHRTITSGRSSALWALSALFAQFALLAQFAFFAQ